MAEPEEPHIRAASRDDAPAIVAMLEAGLRTFGDFAPEWRPPPQEEDAVLATEWVLGRPGTWYVIAEDAHGQAGQCGFHPGHEERMMRGAPIPGLAHFWQLFVRRDLWGSGLAGRLHGMAVDEMRSRGYERARLFTPAGSARARGFYEREGWEWSGRTIAGMGEPPIDLVEYVLDLR